MPSPTTAVVQNYDFGAAPSAAVPAAANQVLKFRVLRGGRIQVTFVNTSNATGDDLHVTAQVSLDNITYVTVTAAKQETLVSNLTIKPGCVKNVTLLLNAGNDVYVRFLATGSSTNGVRGQAQIRDAEDNLSIMNV